MSTAYDDQQNHAEGTKYTDLDSYNIGSGPSTSYNTDDYPNTSKGVKQSNTDLISRLKTRKVLGVGENDSGDIYRSKISQILGHNDHLCDRSLSSYWYWHYLSASFYTLQGFLCFVYPWNLLDITFQKLNTGSAHNSLATRYYGCALLTLASVFWFSMRWGYDKKMAKICMFASTLTQVFQMIALSLSFIVPRSREEAINIPTLSFFFRIFTIILNWHFYYANHMGKTNKSLPNSKDK